MGENIYEFPRDRTAEQSFVVKTFGWMCFALIVTALVALAAAGSGWAERIMKSNLIWLIFIAEIGLVIAISAAINKISAATATMLFILYSALNGLTIGVILLFYTQVSVAQTFFITAGTFGAMSLYGYYTKRDLTSVGNIAFMGLIGIIIASVVNIFFRNEMLYWIVSYLGVGIFVALTAYDTQKIKKMGEMGLEGEAARKGAILGALRLYLDFINLFLFLLRFFGRRR